MKKTGIKFLGLSLLTGTIILAVWGCSSSDSSTTPIKTFTDADYFNAAKSYLTYNQTFGAANDVSHPNLKKIDFQSLPTNSWGGDFQTSHPYGKGKYNELVTVRKNFIMNTENTLMMIKRISPSRKDNTTMTVSMKSGINSTKKWTVGGWIEQYSGIRYKKSYQKIQCDRIVMNAIGQAACLAANGSNISLVRLSEKYGHRIATACAHDINAVNCDGTRTAIVSQKSFNKNTGVVTETPIHPR